MATREATVTWLSGMTFDVAMGHHHMMIDSAPTAEEARGPGPVLLLLGALAGCTAMDVVSILAKSRQPLTRLVVRAVGERAEEHPRRFTHITVTYEFHGDGLDPRAVERAVTLSEEKYCSVSASLTNVVSLSTRIELHDAATAGPAE